MTFVLDDMFARKLIQYLANFSESVYIINGFCKYLYDCIQDQYEPDVLMEEAYPFGKLPKSIYAVTTVRLLFLFVQTSWQFWSYSGTLTCVPKINPFLSRYNRVNANRKMKTNVNGAIKKDLFNFIVSFY